MIESFDKNLRFVGIVGTTSDVVPTRQIVFLNWLGVQNISKDARTRKDTKWSVVCVANRLDATKYRKASDWLNNDARKQYRAESVGPSLCV